jgi:UDP-glucose 4-epimerase
MDTKKTILVTGGAGFIGSHLCERLASDNTVISLDNYFTGSKKNHVDGVEYKRGHTLDIAELITEKIDIVYHLGEYSRVAKSIEEPSLVWDFNIKGTAAVLEFCRKQKCKIVYAGSSTKFSDTREDGIEGVNLSPYTWSKAVNTDLLKNYADWYDLEYAIVYFYNVYGPREMNGEYGTVIEIFKQKYLANLPLPMRLPGTQKRNYTHVYDTIDGIVLAGEKGLGDNFGIGSDTAYTTREMAELFKAEIEELSARKTSRPSAKVDNEKIKALGWKEKYNLKDYVNDFLNSTLSP